MASHRGACYAHAPCNPDASARDECVTRSLAAAMHGAQVMKRTLSIFSWLLGAASVLASSSAHAEDEPVTVVAISAGYAHTCALLSSGAVRCWGDGAWGRLGYANTTMI